MTILQDLKKLHPTLEFTIVRTLKASRTTGGYFVLKAVFMDTIEEFIWNFKLYNEPLTMPKLDVIFDARARSASSYAAYSNVLVQLLIENGIPIGLAHVRNNEHFVIFADEPELKFGL